MFVKGDKVKLKKPMGLLKEVGQIGEIVDVGEDGVVTLRFGDVTLYHFLDELSENFFNNYFEHMVSNETNQTKVLVTEEIVKTIFENSEIVNTKAFDKCTVVSCKLPNGYVIVEHSDCNREYDFGVGVMECQKKILNKIRELETYRLLSESSNKDEDSTSDTASIYPHKCTNGCEQCREYHCNHVANHECGSCSICDINGGCCTLCQGDFE